jgi:hypothetical protein
VVDAVAPLGGKVPEEGSRPHPIEDLVPSEYGYSDAHGDRNGWGTW